MSSGIAKTPAWSSTDAVVADWDRIAPQRSTARKGAAQVVNAHQQITSFSSSMQPTRHDALLEALPHLARRSTFVPSRYVRSARRRRRPSANRSSTHRTTSSGSLRSDTSAPTETSLAKATKSHRAEHSATLAIVSTGDGGMQHTGNMTARHRPDQQQSG
jgi:hypothetical protein